MNLGPPIPKKFKGDHQPGDPLPIPIASLTGLPSSAASWHYHKGIYKDGAVIITDFNDIASLWHNGYFGQLVINNFRNGDRSSIKFLKRWKLLQSKGLKDASFFKKPLEIDDCDVDEEEEVVFVGDSESGCYVEEESKPSTSAESVDLKRDQAKIDSIDIQENALDKSVLRDQGQEDEMDKDTDNQDCETLLTFDSDLISSVFFDENSDYASGGHLKLMLEEAMFLSYALGCLAVGWDTARSGGQRGKKKKKSDYGLNIDQMWREFVSDDPEFVVRYTVYHHYRTKGWVVKSGLKFGADFVLYPVGPPFYHAQFTVMIQCIWADNFKRDESLSSRELSWMNLSATERLNSHVKKTPLIVYVLRPRELSNQDLYNIECVQSLRIQEVSLSRWDPSALKEPDKEEIVIE